jgi:hypothetical protein
VWESVRTGGNLAADRYTDAQRERMGWVARAQFPSPFTPPTHTRPATAVEIADVMPPADLFDVTGETSLKLER